MGNVPDTTTFRFTDVTAIIDSGDMITAFASSISGAFDSRYAGSKNLLLNFRNYGATPSTPVITLVGASVVTITQNNAYTEFGATATDAVWGNLTSNIVISGTVDTSTIGTYTKYYNVTNPNGTPAVQVTRTVVVSAAAAAIVCLYGAAGYTSPPNYPPVILTAGGGYTEACLSSLGLAIGGTSALSSVCFVDHSYTMTVYDNGTPSSTGDFTGKRYSQLNSSVNPTYLQNFNYLCFSGTSCVINDQTRSLCLIYTASTTTTVTTLDMLHGSTGTDGVDTFVSKCVTLSPFASGCYNATFNYNITKPSTSLSYTETTCVTCNGAHMYCCSVTAKSFTGSGVFGTFTVTPSDCVVLMAFACGDTVQGSATFVGTSVSSIAPIVGSFTLGSPSGVSVYTYNTGPPA